MFIIQYNTDSNESCNKRILQFNEDDKELHY